MSPSFAHTDASLTPIRSPLDIQGLELLFKNIGNNPTTPPQEVHFNTQYHSNWSNSNLNITLPLTALQFSHGQSNPTYLITDSQGFRFVLRRKPSSNSKLFSKKAHSIEREFHILNAIADINAANKSESSNGDVPVAEVYLLCEDESYIGCVFYLMQFVQGRIFHDPGLTGISDKMAYYKEAIRVTSNIHSVNSLTLSRKLPISHFQTNSTSSSTNLNFFQRQVHSLSKIHNSQCQINNIPEIPHFKQLSTYLQTCTPSSPSSSTSQLIHGDLKLDNLIYHPTKPRIISILDWELTTLQGDPIFDLANLLQPWYLTKDLNRLFNGVEVEPSCEFIKEMLLEYKSVNQLTSWDPLSVWKQGKVFALYRLAVIVHGIAARVQSGVASSAKAKEIAKLYPELGRFAYQMIKEDLAVLRSESKL